MQDDVVKKFKWHVDAVRELQNEVRPLVINYYKQFVDIDNELIAFAQKYNLTFNVNFYPNVQLDLPFISGSTVETHLTFSVKKIATGDTGWFYYPIDEKQREAALKDYKSQCMLKLQKQLAAMRIEWEQALSLAEKAVATEQKKIKYLKEMMGEDEKQKVEEKRIIEVRSPDVNIAAGGEKLPGGPERGGWHHPD